MYTVARNVSYVSNKMYTHEHNCAVENKKKTIMCEYLTAEKQLKKIVSYAKVHQIRTQNDWLMKNLLTMPNVHEAP